MLDRVVGLHHLLLQYQHHLQAENAIDHVNDASSMNVYYKTIGFGFWLESWSWIKKIRLFILPKFCLFYIGKWLFESEVNVLTEFDTYLFNVAGGDEVKRQVECLFTNLQIRCGQDTQYVHHQILINKSSVNYFFFTCFFLASISVCLTFSFYNNNKKWNENSQHADNTSFQSNFTGRKITFSSIFLRQPSMKRFSNK